MIIWAEAGNQGLDIDLNSFTFLFNILSLLDWEYQRHRIMHYMVKLWRYNHEFRSMHLFFFYFNKSDLKTELIDVSGQVNTFSKLQ